jgi:outer membrane protein OmpA-like peptidoglycan-associated protein
VEQPVVKSVRVPIQEESVEDSASQEEATAEEEAAVEEESAPQEESAAQEEAAAQEESAAQEEEQPEASPEWPEEEEEDGDLEIVTVGQQEYFRTSNNGLFTVTRDEEGNPEIGTWAGVLSDDGTQVIEASPPNDA